MKVLKNFTCLSILLMCSVALGGFASKTNGEYITVSGKIITVKPDSFRLKTKDRIIFVEMDDYDWDADGYKLVKGDQVVVTGKIDNDFLEKKKIEAGSVYVKGINSYFFANSDDEEGAPYLTTTINPYVVTLPENTQVAVQGKVVNVNGRQFTVDTGLRKLKIETSELIYNPLDDNGYTQIDLGDWVRVSGIVEENFFGKDEINADYVIEL